MNTCLTSGLRRVALVFALTLIPVKASAAVVDQPQFSPAAGTYTVSQSVALSTATNGANIRYTLDGSTPTETHGQVYAEPIPITETKTLRAVAYQVGSTTSAEQSGTYTINANLLGNLGGFEGTYNSGVAPGWRNFPIARYHFSYAMSESSVARSGLKSQQIQITKLMSGSAVATFAIPGGIVIGNDYEARVWLKSSRRTDHGASLGVSNNTPWFPTPYSYICRPVGQQWTELVLRFRATTTDTSANLAIGYDQESTLWIDDASFRRLVPADRPAAPAAGNLIRNGSFETGLSGWINGNYSTISIVNTGAFHGGRALNLSWNGQSGGRLHSRGLNLPWGHTYTLSFYAKGASGAAIGSSMMNRASALVSKTHTLASTGWERFTHTFTLPPMADEIAYLEIDPPNGGGLQLDGIQIEAAAAETPFAPRATVESELILGRASGVYTIGETVSGTLALYNNASTTQNITLRRRVRDLWDNDVAGTATTWTQSLPPGLTTLAVTLTPSTLTGAFRAESDNGGGTTAPPYAETAFTVLPPAPALGSNSGAGVCLDYNSTTLTRTGGAGWTKSFLPGWKDVQPSTNGPFTFAYDARFNAWVDSGLNTLGIIGSVPAWAQNLPPGVPAPDKDWYPPQDYNAMQTYAQQTVTHYMDKVALWELENEPTQHIKTLNGDTLEVEYARQALALANGALAADSSALLLLGSITTLREPATFIADVFTHQPTLRDLVHGVSYHFYTGDPAIIRRIASSVRAKLVELGLGDLKIWDTEWYPVDHSLSIYRDELRPVTDKHDTARRVTSLVAQGYIARLGEGLEGSILYQSYNPGNMGASVHTATYELDGRPRPSLAITAAFTQQLTGVTNPMPLAVTGCWAYRFDRPDGRKVTTIWTDDYQAGNVNYTTPTAVTATDMMGNPAGTYAAGQIISVGPDPIYLLGPAPYVVEAETGALAGGSQLYTETTASGGVMVGKLDASGRSVTYSGLPNFHHGGQTRIELLTGSLPGGSLTVQVNNATVGTLTCPSTGGWRTLTNKSAIDVTLAPGTNTVRFIYASGGTNIDTVTFTPVLP